MSPEATNPPPAPLRTPSKPATDGQGIALRTSFFVLDWTVNFTRTTVIVDGHPWELPWGEYFLPLAPGRHELQVSYWRIRPKSRLLRHLERDSDLGRRKNGPFLLMTAGVA